MLLGHTYDLIITFEDYIIIQLLEFSGFLVQ
jgi:hypothetical protein